MKQEERQLNLDLDVLSFAKSINESEDECVFYVRRGGNKISAAYGGLPANVVNSIVDLMNNDDHAYDVFSAAVSLFEEDSFQVTEEKEDIQIKDIFLQYNVICSGIAVLFAEKHGVEFESWSGGVVGSKAVFGKDAVVFTDMVHDLENDMPAGVYWQYVDSGENDYPAYCNHLENNSIYCSNCDTLVSNDLADWTNDTAICCYCGSKLKL